MSFKKEILDDWDPDDEKIDDWNDELFIKETNEQRISNLEKSIKEIKEAIVKYMRQPVVMSDVNVATLTVEKPCNNVLITEDGNKDSELVDKESFRKVFAPSCENKKGNRPLVVTSTPTGCYIRSRKSQETHIKLFGPLIPNWLSLLFKPIKAMTLNSDECAMASYMFGRSTNDKEVLIVSHIPFCEGTRGVLQDLKPREMLSQDIINLVVCMLTYHAKDEVMKRGIWFLPTTFSQYVLAWNAQTQAMMKKYHNKFMGNADMISKVFLPVHDSEYSHWFLLVIDLEKKELIYLDSLPSRSARPGRMRNIKKLALYMEELLMDPSFYLTWSTNKPNISEFSLVTPKDLGMQAANSNDCGIWVIMWMMQLGANQYKIDVDEGTRLRIALDLILDPSNVLSETTLAVAKQSTRVEQCN